MPNRLLALGLVLAVAPLTTSTSEAAGAPTGTIVAEVAGDRDVATGDVRMLPATVVRAYADAALTIVVGECTTDVTGTCTIDGLADGTYHVAPAHAPAGGPFRLRGPVALSSGVVPDAEVVEVGEGHPSTRTFVLRRDNPPFPTPCGVTVTLLYDVSGSISASEAANMMTASLEFVDALAGTPSAVAVATFASAAPAAGNVDLPLTSVATPTGVAAVKAAIGAMTQPTGDDRFTNWDAAFRSVAGHGDIIVLLTDGNPTVYGVPATYPPVTTGFAQVDAGVLSANAAKAAGARVLAVGVGDLDALSRENLAAVSGPVEGVDFAITTFAEVHRVFRRLADEVCASPDRPTSTPPRSEPVPVPPRFTG